MMHIHSFSEGPNFFCAFRFANACEHAMTRHCIAKFQMNKMQIYHVFTSKKAYFTSPKNKSFQSPCRYSLQCLSPVNCTCPGLEKIQGVLKEKKFQVIGRRNEFFALFSLHNSYNEFPREFYLGFVTFPLQILFD